MQEALYRKHRPDSLKKLVGQPDAITLIEKQIKNNNLSHAYLFSGPRGVGKTSLARIIATTLGCDPISMAFNCFDQLFVSSICIKILVFD